MKLEYLRHNVVGLALSTALIASLSGPAFAQHDANAATEAAASGQKTIEDFQPVTADDLSGKNPANWPILRGNYQGWGYSALDQINKDNVGQLQLVWSRTMEPGSNEGAALAYNGVIFLGNTNDVIQAIDAKDGSLIWQYKRKLPPASKFINSLGAAKRSVAIYGDKVYFVSWDNFVVALDAKTGKLVWETNRGQGVEEGVSNSSGPIVVDGVVVAGSTCQFSEFGCYVTGTDAETGEELWRNTFIPRPGEEGDETWGGAPMENRWMTGAWGQITYDPELDLVYYGSTGAGPASEVQRGTEGGTLAGTNTRFAVKPKTGEVVWKHQTLPRDNWDSECTFEMMVISTAVNPNAEAEGMMSVGANVPRGETRKVLTGIPCKTGIAWQFDAETGEYFWSKQTVKQNSIASIDDKGLVTVNEDMILKEPGKAYNYCPTYLGGRDWPSAGYLPKSNLYVIPMTDACYELTARTSEPTGADVYNTDSKTVFVDGKNTMGRVDAIDLATGETKWTYETRAALYDPVLTTGGDLVFVGGIDRQFRALDGTTGKEIWSTRLPGAVSGYTTTYSVDGRQYIAVVSGGSLGGPSFGPSTPEVDSTSGANGIYVFALPEAK